MTLVEGTTDVYSYTFTDNYSIVAFTQASQNNYEFFWETKAVYRGDFSTSKPMYIPETTTSGTFNQNVPYYNNGTWSTYTPGGGGDDTELSIYVQGRFKVRTSKGGTNWLFTGDDEEKWNTSSKNIKFEYEEATGYYKLNTYCSVEELAGKTPNNEGYYFHFKEGNTEYGANADNVKPALETAKRDIQSSSRNFIFTTTDCTAGDNVVLYLDWDKKKFWYAIDALTPTYTVTFDANGRDNAENMPEAQKIKEGQSAVQPTDDPIATGYTFGGWYTEKECTTTYDFTTLVTTDITLYAKWTEKPKYTVTISAADKNGSVDPNGIQQIGEIPVTITAKPNSGYQLDKWETEGGVVVKEQAGASITVTATATGSVTATFTEATPKLNIGANSNGSVCGEGEYWTIQPFTKVPNETGIYSTQITLKAGTFTFSIIGTDGKFYKNDGKMTRAFWGNFIFNTEKKTPDARIEADVEGTYEFRWDNPNKKLFVYYPLPDNFYYYDKKGDWEDANCKTFTKKEYYAYIELTSDYLYAANNFKIFDGNTKSTDDWYKYGKDNEHTIACGNHIDNTLGDITLTNGEGDSPYQNATYETTSITGDKFYVLLYYPNTPVNSTGAYKLAASTTLPGTGGEYSVTILTNNASYGTVSPAGIQGINKGETLTITATPKKGYMLDADNPWSATEGITVTPTEGNPNEATVSAIQSGTVTANFVKDPNFADNPCVALHGNFTGEWKSTLMEISPDGKTATYTLNITGTGNKNFGIKVLNECSTDFSDKNKKAWMWGEKSNHNISRTTRTLKLIEQSGDNGADISMLVDIAGYYKFTYTYATKELTVEYPSKEIKPQQYLLYGNFEGTEWVTKEGEWKDSNQVGTWTLSLKKGAYMFKLLSVTAGSPSLNAQKGAATIQRENPDVMVDGEYSSNDRENITLNADEDGEYTVIFSYTAKKVYVTYPGGSKTKYRLVYAEKKPNNTYEKYHPSTPYIDALAEGATEVRRDIVSLHVRCSIPDYDRNSLEQIEKIAGYKKNNNSLFVYLQRWNGEQWETIQTLSDLATNESIAGKNGVYNFVVVQDPHAEEETRKVYIDEKIEAYKGNYYIRTNVAPGGWNDYKQTANQITYSDYAAQHKHFDHYWCKWVAVTGENAEPSAVEGKVNLKFTIANDYSNCVSDTCLDEMDNRQFTENGRLGSNANVRWMWHSKTNDIDRAYIAGGNECLFFVPKEGNIICKDKESPFAFDDRENWTYKIDVTTPPNTKFAITKKPHGDAGDTRYYILGSETEGVPLITGQGNQTYSMRVVYDFKSDHLIYAWVPGDNTEIKSDWELGTSIVCMRIGHNRATQIAISPKSTQLNEVKSALGVLSLTKNDFYDNYTPDKMWECEYYWISFPFDVCISDIFSTFVLGRHYRIQDYDGASRAKNGCWIDSPSYWRTLSKSDTLKAGMGYLLNIRHSKVAEDKLYDNNPTELNIYFPSAGDKVMEITGTFPTVTVPEHKCKIERENRNIYDSNWNLIGVPSWVNITGIGNGTVSDDPGNTVLNIYGETKIGFYYHFNTGENGTKPNTWTPRNVIEKTGEKKDSLVFQNMHSYLVQWAGTINWNNPSFDEPSAQGLQARRVAEAKPEEYTLRLELSRGETALDQTFVRLQEDGDVTADYDMNYDMTKIINPGANLYSLIGEKRIQAGANVQPLPAENTTVYVPVGVVADRDGMYRFSMPDGTEGMLVSLADHETGRLYNLATGYCDVPLTAGTYEQRFVLEIQPKKGVTTGCNESTTDDGTLRKVLIDGNLYIQRGDALYDAAGRAL